MLSLQCVRFGVHARVKTQVRHGSCAFCNNALGRKLIFHVKVTATLTSLLAFPDPVH